MTPVPDRAAARTHPAAARRASSRSTRRAPTGWPGGRRRWTAMSATWMRRRSGPRQGQGRRVTALWSQVYAEPSVRGRGPGRAARSSPRWRSPAPPAASRGSAAAGTCRVRISSRWGPTGWRWPSASSASRTSGADAAPAASTARRWCSWRCSAPAARRRAIPTCRRRSSATELAPDAALRRGDLVFWRGHVGIMQDAETLLHANAPPHGGGERALAAGDRADRGGGRRAGHPPPEALTSPTA